MPFTFVHAADLHLDSPLEGLSADASQTPAVAEAAREATFVALDRLVETCLAEQAEFLVLAGDIYDREYRTARAQLRFRDALVQLASRGIRTFMVHGNHDPALRALKGLSWPEEVTVFGTEEVETREFRTTAGELVTVSGISYRAADERRKLHRMFEKPGCDGYHVAVLHCSLASHRGRASYCECSLEDLAARGFDYWALGHVHTRKVVCTDSPCVVYPGNPQGREIRETGPRGCMVVRADGAARRPPELEFRALDAVRWDQSEVDLSGVETLDKVEDALIRRCGELRDAAERDLICRLRLTGRTPLFHDLCKPDTLRDLTDRARQQLTREAPFVWVEKLASAVRPPIDLASRAEEQDLLGEVLRYAASLADSGEPGETLGGTCDELLEHTRMARAVEAPDGGEWADILDQARLLCVDLLETEEAE